MTPMNDWMPITTPPKRFGYYDVYYEYYNLDKIHKQIAVGVFTMPMGGGKLDFRYINNNCIMDMAEAFDRFQLIAWKERSKPPSEQLLKQWRDPNVT